MMGGNQDENINSLSSNVPSHNKPGAVIGYLYRVFFQFISVIAEAIVFVYLGISIVYYF